MRKSGWNGSNPRIAAASRSGWVLVTFDSQPNGRLTVNGVNKPWAPADGTSDDHAVGVGALQCLAGGVGVEHLQPPHRPEPQALVLALELGGQHREGGRGAGFTDQLEQQLQELAARLAGTAPQPLRLELGDQVVDVGVRVFSEEVESRLALRGIVAAHRLERAGEAWSRGSGHRSPSAGQRRAGTQRRGRLRRPGSWRAGCGKFTTVTYRAVPTYAEP